MSEWIKCSDRLPEEDVGVLVWTPFVKYEGGWIGMASHHNSFFKTEDGELICCTHWMPLPDAPDGVYPIIPLTPL